MNQESLIGPSKIEWASVLFLVTILGAILGWFLPVIADWALHLPIPFKGGRLFEWISSLNSLWISIITTVIGIVAGLLLSLYAINESHKVIVSDQEVRLIFKNKEKTIKKKDISAVYIENKNLVILGTEGNELYREPHESRKRLVKETLENYRYPWVEEDPHEGQYQRWVQEHPDFPPRVNALLSAREKAILGDKNDDAEILRKDLAKLGVVIRDEDKRQYVRML